MPFPLSLATTSALSMARASKNILTISDLSPAVTHQVDRHAAAQVGEIRQLPGHNQPCTIMP
jgi:hypothetical protein